MSAHWLKNDVGWEVPFTKSCVVTLAKSNVPDFTPEEVEVIRQQLGTVAVNKTWWYWGVIGIKDERQYTIALGEFHSSKPVSEVQALVERLATTLLEGA
jgi:hypothetical protein